MELQRGQTLLTSILAAMAVSASWLVLAPPSPAQPRDPCPIGNVLVTVERLQGGFSGQTGDRISIGEDGCFTVDRVINDKMVSRLRSGKLSSDRIASARAAIEAAHITSLPDRSGTLPPVNPTTLSISYRGTTKTVVAPSGTSIEGMAVLEGGSLARLAARLIELTGS
jgi:hypothetical protein